ncbi:MAG: plastocyanin [Betaproteobacteria bacterium]|nr:MAG: plastocyanin [Betaproteobacteria bacterium]
MHKSLFTAACIAAALATAPAWAHSDSHGKKTTKPAAQNSEEKAFGKAGDPKKVTRTIAVDMSDQMRFTPAALTIKPGETVKFVVKNSGKVMHEFVLGTLPELKEHAELMKKFPNMEHDEPYMAHVSPGKTETIVWQFSKGGEFHFGCLLPGHFEAGMVGKINVTQR